jgi:hypothetical protein
MNQDKGIIPQRYILEYFPPYPIPCDKARESMNWLVSLQFIERILPEK